MIQIASYSRAGCLLAALALCVGTSSTAYAISGELESAGMLMLSFETPREEVRAALEHPGCTFIGGSFINARSSLRFSGGATAVRGMAEKLAELPGVTTSISFIRADDASDWHVTHDARNGTFQIALNLNSRRIEFDELVITYTHGTKAPPSERD